MIKILYIVILSILSLIGVVEIIMNYIDNKKSNVPAPVVTFVNNGEKLVYASDGILQGTKAPEAAGS